MNRKKLIIFALIIILLIAILINVGDSSKDTKKENVQIENIQYEDTEEHKEEIKLTGVINGLQTLLNEKNLDKLYELIDEDYRDYKFENKKELFDDYMNSYFSDDAELSLQTYEKVSNTYICRILSHVKDEYKSFPIIIKEEKDGLYSIILDDISHIDKKDISQTNTKGLEASILYYIAKDDTAIYLIEYANKSKEQITYELEEASLYDSYGYSYYAKTNLETIQLKAGEKVRQELYFNDKEIHSYVKMDLELNFKDNSSLILDFNESGIEY